MWQRHRPCCPMISTKCTECWTVGEGAMICFSPSVCLPISRDSATLSSPPFFAQTKRNGGDQKKLQLFQLTKASTGTSPFIYLLLAHRAEFTSPLDLSACPAEKVYPRAFAYHTSMCSDCRLLGRTWLDQRKTHQLEDVLTGFCPKSSVLSTLAPRLIRVSQAACIPAIAARCSGVCFFCKAFILDFIIFLLPIHNICLSSS